MRILLLSFLPLLAACGATNTPSEDSSTDDGCAGYHAGDACVTDENLAQCREREAECPGAVVVLESCPLQFACP